MSPARIFSQIASSALRREDRGSPGLGTSAVESGAGSFARSNKHRGSSCRISQLLPLGDHPGSSYAAGCWRRQQLLPHQVASALFCRVVLFFCSCSTLLDPVGGTTVVG